MTDRGRSARTRAAFGRFLSASLVLPLVAACTVVGTSGARETEPPAVRPRATEPALAPGPIAPAREAEAAGLLRRAEEAMESGRPADGLRLSGDLITRFPTASFSARALLLHARAALAVGDSVAAATSAERYLSLLPADDPRATPAALLQAEALGGDPAARLDRLLRLSPRSDSTDVERAIALARESVALLDAAELDEVLARVPADGPVGAVPMVRRAQIHFEAREDAAATQLATRALASAPRAPEADAARALLRRDLRDRRSRPSALSVGMVLPLGGPPALADFARLVAEGVEVAATSVLAGVQVQVSRHDDEGDVGLAAEATRSLESAGVVGVIGFLEDHALDAAGGARTRDLPLVSPTARNARTAGAGAYSLTGPDPDAARQIAAFAASAGYLRVAILHSTIAESVEEADAFERAVQEAGIPMVGRFAYQDGATFFEPQIREAQRALRAAEIRALGLGPDDTLRVEMLEPVALFVPIPSEDVEFVAPQLTHFGLDTLAVQILGTNGWSDGRTLRIVNRRHTNGVVATAPDGGPGSPGHARFREAYEQHFQRTLVSPVPALGYDAALLLLEAARSGAGATEVRAGFERLRDVEGAAGVYSVVDGRIERRTHVVRIESGAVVPIG